MAFDIVLQRNKSDRNCLTKDVETIATYTGVLRTPSSIVDPVIIIECDLANVNDANYMTISSFGRSYYINNITSVTQDLVEFRAHCDVLASFADEIKANNAILTKQQDLWNLYLNDGSFKIYQNPNVLTRAFPSGFNTLQYVLAVAGS